VLITRHRSKNFGKVKTQIPIISKELMIIEDDDNSIDITAILYDPKSERRLKDKSGAYGINFVLSPKETKELKDILDNHKINGSGKYSGSVGELKKEIADLRYQNANLSQENIDANMRAKNHWVKVEELGVKLNSLAKTIKELYQEIELKDNMLLNRDAEIKVVKDRLSEARRKLQTFEDVPAFFAKKYEPTIGGHAYAEVSEEPKEEVRSTGNP
jgi:hypothetical protein